MRGPYHSMRSTRSSVPNPARPLTRSTLKVAIPVRGCLSPTRFRPLGGLQLATRRDRRVLELFPGMRHHHDLIRAHRLSRLRNLHTLIVLGVPAERPLVPDSDPRVAAITEWADRVARDREGFMTGSEGLPAWPASASQCDRWQRAGITRLLGPVIAVAILTSCAGSDVDEKSAAADGSSPQSSPTLSTSMSTRQVDPNGFILAERPGCAADAGGDLVRATTSEGNGVAFLLIGTGTNGVVLAPQSGGGICEWLPYAEELATRYRVALFDWKEPRSEMPALAAAALRRAGVRSVVLCGASPAAPWRCLRRTGSGRGRRASYRSAGSDPARLRRPARHQEMARTTASARQQARQLLRQWGCAEAAPPASRTGDRRHAPRVAAAAPQPPPPPPPGVPS